MAEFQPILSMSATYNSGDRLGQYRGTVIYSGGILTGTSQSAAQCVDFAKAFASTQFGTNLNGTGNAVDYGSQNAISSAFGANNLSSLGGYRVYENSGSAMPQENDIISWSGGGGGLGHVGIIAEVQFNNKTGQGYVYTLEQNARRDQALFPQPVTRSYGPDGKPIYIVGNRLGGYQVQGWARYENSSKVPGSEKYTSTPATPAPKTPRNF